MKLYTIGHSNVLFETLVENLKRHGVELLVDVRSSPYSKYASQFNHDRVRADLPQYDISYEFMGDSLGGLPQKPEFTDAKGKADYDKMAQDKWFIEGLERLVKLAAEKTTCIMCSEEDPAKCHRSRLISSRLAQRDVEVQHIRGDGTLESEEDNAKKRFSPKESQMDLFS